MAGEIANAFIALSPTMRGFGAGIVSQGGPQIAAAGRQLGTQGGTALGSALGGATAKSAIPAINQVNSAISAAHSSNSSWLADSAAGAVKNVALYGSMYLAIQTIKQGMSAALDAMVGFNAELEKSTIGFTTLLGSAAAAQEQMAWIKDFARETPFQYQDLVGYSQQLLALGFNAEQSRQVLQATGDAAAALGRGSESIARINLALGQMWSKGKVQSQEMLQLTEAGISGWQILADAYGTSVAEVQDAVTAGLISAQEAVPALLEGMNNRFGGLMEQQAQTYAGVMSNIQDTLNQQLAEAGEPLFHELEAQARAFLEALDDPEVLKTMQDMGHLLADGAKALANAAGFALEHRNAIAAVAVGYLALKVAQGWTVKHFSAEAVAAREATIAWRAVPAALTGVKSAQVAATAANQAALRASIGLGVARQAETRAAAAAATASQALSSAVLRDSEAHRIASAANHELARAKNAVVVANDRLIISENAATAAMQRSAAATQARATAFGKLGPLLSTGGMLVGAPLLMDGWSKAAEAATADTQNLGDSVTGLGEAVAGGALAGAAFGAMFANPVTIGVGAAAGAVVGLVGGLWSMQAAMDAANADTSLAVEALRSLGVEANLAALALSGVTNEQLEAAGGFGAVLDAMKAGGYSEYIADLREQAKALHEQVAAAQEAANAAAFDATADPGAAKERFIDLQNEARLLDEALAALTANGPALAAANDQIAASAYQAAYAADLQTGALGNMTQAAWDAIVAEGGLGAEALTAALRMEGLAGVAGYATQMIAGIPKGTAINFSTNASDILGQIMTLRAASETFGQGGGSMTADAFDQRMRDLKARYSAALSAAGTSLVLPTGGGSKKGGSAASRAADAAAKAAEEAARKLQQDREAQLRFGDAFGTIMEAALGGNFEQYRDRLEDQITSLTRDGYKVAADTLKRLSGTLTQATMDYAALTNKLEAATDAYDDLTGRMQDQYNTSRDLILGLGQVTDAQSFDQLAYLLGQTTSAATQYQDVLKQLKDQGLSEDLWNQLAQAGPESMGLAQSILAQGQAGIEQLNSLSGGLLDAADSMGSLVADSMFKQGAEAIKAYIEGMQSGSDALRNQMAQIANNTLTQTASAITPGNAGYTSISAQPKQTVTNHISVTIPVDDLDDLKKIQDFLRMLDSAPTTQLVNQAGFVTS